MVEATAGSSWATNFRDIAVGAAALAGSILIPLASHEAAQVQHRSELARHYVELGISVLREPEAKAQSSAVRSWAQQVVNHYGEVPLTAKAAEQLQERLPTVLVPVPCAAAVGDPPAYPDTPAALRVAPDIFERTKLLLAGRQLRDARIASLEAAVSACNRRTPSASQR